MVLQLFRVRLQVGDGQVRRAALHPLQHIQAGVLLNLQVHRGVVLREIRHNLRQDIDPQQAQRGDHQLAGHAGPHGGKLQLHLLVQLLKALNIVQIFFSGGGKAQGGGVPVEERHPQLLLHLLHQPAQGGLGDIQLLRRLGDAVALRNRPNVLASPVVYQCPHRLSSALYNASVF